MIARTAYICGPLTNLALSKRGKVKKLYSSLADVCEDVLEVRAFVPHEHFDPIKHAEASPQQVDAAERHQIYEKTSLLIVVAAAPSWGGGIEVEMARYCDIPIILFVPTNKSCSRLLRGNPGIRKEIKFEKLSQIPELLRSALKNGGLELVATD